MMEQLHELQFHVRYLSQYDCVLPEKFQVNVILAKLPPSRRGFVTARRHLKERLTLNELSAAINIEECARLIQVLLDIYVLINLVSLYFRVNVADPSR